MEVNGTHAMVTEASGTHVTIIEVTEDTPDGNRVNGTPSEGQRDTGNGRRG